MRARQQTKVELPDGAVEMLAAFADTLIPSAGGFPSATQAGVVEDFVLRYLEADDAGPGYFPNLQPGDVTRLSEALADSFLDADADARTARVRAVEASLPELFGRWQSCIYHGYYSRPLVVEAIRANLDAGRDYHGAPQPYGYAETTEKWDPASLKHVGGAGYVATDEVVPLDRARLDAMTTAQGGVGR